MCTGYAGATGYAAKHLPPGEQREYVMTLIRQGVKFKQQQTGRKPGTLSKLVTDAVINAGGQCTFDALIYELELCAARRELHGQHESPVEKVDRTWQIVIYHDPKKGRTQVEFSTLRNKLTASKKIVACMNSL